MAGVNRDKRLPPAAISVSHKDLKEKKKVKFEFTLKKQLNLNSISKKHNLL